MISWIIFCDNRRLGKLSSIMLSAFSIISTALKGSGVGIGIGWSFEEMLVKGYTMTQKISQVSVWAYTGGESAWYSQRLQ
jgi:hypothetical protein